MFAAQVEVAVAIVKRRKRVMCWQMFDLHGISPSLWMHKIFMLEGHNLVAQPQKKMNPIMKEVAKREIIK